MLLKMAWRGALRNARDYLVYLMTVSFSFALVYAFNTLVFSQEFRTLNTRSADIVLMIILLSILVIFILGWLVSYMTGFILSKRSRELGLYMLIGIKRSSIALLFLLENVILGCLALLLSIFIGTGIYQLLISLVTYVFAMPYEIVLTFSPWALAVTFLYILLIYFFATVRRSLQLRKTNIRELLQGIHDSAPNRRSRLRNLLLFLLSLILLVFGCMKVQDTCTLTNTYMGRDLMVSLVCLVLGLYLFYANLSALIVQWLLRRTSFAYRKDRLILLRGLSARLGAMGTTLGTLAMLFMLILTSLQAGWELKAVFDIQKTYIVPYDVVIYSPDRDFSSYRPYLEEELGIADEHVYPTYISDSHALHDYFMSLPLIRFNYDTNDILVALSDYNALRRIKGLDPIVLETDQYALATLENVPAYLKKPLPNLWLKKGTLSCQAVYTDAVLSGTQHVCIVPDAYVTDYPVDYYTLAVRTLRPTTEADFLAIHQSIGAPSYLYYGNVRMQGAVQAEGQSYLLMIIFALFYVGMILICACAAILAVRQISDTLQHRYRYQILSHLGFSEKRTDRYLRHQLFVYFGVPLLLPLPLSVFTSLCLHDLMRPYVADTQVFLYACLSIGIFLLIYSIYLAATYIGCRKNIQEGWHPLD